MIEHRLPSHSGHANDASAFSFSKQQLRPRERMGLDLVKAAAMVRTMNLEWGIAWPPDQMPDVPLRFILELSNPFPGEDPGARRHPITLQSRPRVDRSHQRSPGL